MRLPEGSFIAFLSFYKLFRINGQILVYPTKKGNIRYYSIYMISFVQKEEPMEDMIYKPNLSVLK